MTNSGRKILLDFFWEIIELEQDLPGHNQTATIVDPRPAHAGLSIDENNSIRTSFRSILGFLSGTRKYRMDIVNAVHILDHG
jgi:hypothetical protein